MNSILLSLLVIFLTVWSWQNRYELRMVSCYLYARFTDPPGVRTDGLCALAYLIDTREPEKRID